MPLIVPVGTQVVALRPVVGQAGRVLHPRGAVGVVVRAPSGEADAYRVRFPDGVEESLAPAELVMLARYKAGRDRRRARHANAARLVRPSDPKVRGGIAGLRAR